MNNSYVIGHCCLDTGIIAIQPEVVNHHQRCGGECCQVHIEQCRRAMQIISNDWQSRSWPYRLRVPSFNMGYIVNSTGKYLNQQPAHDKIINSKVKLQLCDETVMPTTFQ